VWSKVVIGDSIHLEWRDSIYNYVVLRDGVLSRPASPDSEQLGVPTVPGRIGAIGLMFWYVLEHN
jgi:hypothetical protein